MPPPVLAATGSGATAPDTSGDPGAGAEISDEYFARLQKKYGDQFVSNLEKKYGLTATPPASNPSQGAEISDEYFTRLKQKYGITEAAPGITPSATAPPSALPAGGPPNAQQLQSQPFSAAGPTSGGLRAAPITFPPAPPPELRPGVGDLRRYEDTGQITPPVPPAPQNLLRPSVPLQIGPSQSEQQLARIDALVQKALPKGQGTGPLGSRVPDRGPLHDLREQQTTALLATAPQLKTVFSHLDQQKSQNELEFLRLHFLKGEGDQFLTPAQRQVRDRQIEENIHNRVAIGRRYQQLLGLAKRLDSVISHYNETPLHGGMRYPEERYPGEDLLAYLWKHTPGTMQELIQDWGNPAGFTGKALDNLHRAEAHRMLTGDIPPPVPLPPGTKADRQRLINEKNDLVTKILDRPWPGGILPLRQWNLDTTDRQIEARRQDLLRRPPPDLTGWQQRIYGVVVQQYIGEEKAKADARFNRALAIDLGINALTLGAFGVANKPLQRFILKKAGDLIASRGLEAVLLHQGREAAFTALAKHYGLRAMTSGALASGTASIAAPLAVLGTGGTFREAGRSALPAAERGAVAGLALELFSGLLAVPAQVSRFARDWSPGNMETVAQQVRTAAARRGWDIANAERFAEIGRDVARAQGINNKTRVFNELVREMSGRGAQAPTGSVYETPTTGPPAAPGTAPPAAPGVNLPAGPVAAGVGQAGQLTVEPLAPTPIEIRTPGETIRAQSPADLEQLAQQAAEQGDLARVAAIQHWQAAHQHWNAQNNLALPPELRPDFETQWNQPNNAARRQYDVIEQGAERLTESNKPLADLLAEAARQTRQAAIRQAIEAATSPNDLLAQQQASPPVGPPQVSIYRQLTDAQKAELSNAVQRQLLTQDLSNSQQVLAPGTAATFTHPLGRNASLTDLKRLADERFAQAQAKAQAEQDAAAAQAQVAQAAPTPTPPQAPVLPTTVPETATPAGAGAAAPETPVPAAPPAAPGAALTPPAAAETTPLAPGVVPIAQGGGGGEAVPELPAVTRPKRSQIVKGARVRLQGRTYEIIASPVKGQVSVRDMETGAAAQMPVQQLVDQGELMPATAAPVSAPGPDPTTQAPRAPRTTKAAPEKARTALTAPVARATPVTPVAATPPEGVLVHAPTGAQVRPLGNSRTVAGRAVQDVRVVEPGSYAPLAGKQGQTIPFPQGLLQRDFGASAPTPTPEKVAPPTVPTPKPTAAKAQESPPLRSKAQSAIDAYEAKLAAKYGDEAIHETNPFLHNSPLAAAEKRKLGALYEARKQAGEAATRALLEARKAARPTPAAPPAVKTAAPARPAEIKPNQIYRLAKRPGVVVAVTGSGPAGTVEATVVGAGSEVPVKVGTKLRLQPRELGEYLATGKPTAASVETPAVPAAAPAAPPTAAAPALAPLPVAAPVGKPAPYYAVGNVNGQFDQTKSLKGFKTREAALSWARGQAAKNRFVRFQVVPAAELGKQTRFPLAQAPPAGKPAISPSELKGAGGGTAAGTTAPSSGEGGGTSLHEHPPAGAEGAHPPATAAPGATGVGHPTAGGEGGGSGPVGGGVRATGGAAARGKAKPRSGAGSAGWTVEAGGPNPPAVRAPYEAPRLTRQETLPEITGARRQGELKITGNTGDPEVDRALTAARGPLEAQPLFTQIIKGVGQVVERGRALVHLFDRPVPGVNPDVAVNAEFLKAYQQVQRAWTVARNRMTAHARASIGRLRPEEQAIFLDALITREAPYDLARAREAWVATETAKARGAQAMAQALSAKAVPEQPLPPEPVFEAAFGLNSANIDGILAEINRKVAANEAVRTALEVFDRFRTRVVSEYLTAHLAARGWQPAFPNENYVHHEIIRYLQEDGSIGGFNGVSYETPGWRGEQQARQPGTTEPWRTSYGEMIGRVMARMMADTTNLRFAARLVANDHGPEIRAMAIGANHPEVLGSLRQIVAEGVEAITKGSSDKPGSQSTVNMTLLGKAAKDGHLPDTLNDRWAPVLNTLASYYELAAGLPRGQYPPFPSPAALAQVKDYADWFISHLSTRPGVGVRLGDVARMRALYAPVLIENSAYLQKMYQLQRGPTNLTLGVANDPESATLTPAEMDALKASMEGGPAFTRTVAAKARRNVQRPMLWLPKEWAGAVATMHDPGIDADLKQLQGAWQALMRGAKIAKYITPWQIGGLLRLKTSTDLAGVYFTNPDAFKYLPQAFMAMRTWRKTGVASPDIEHFLYDGGASRMFFSMAEDLREPEVETALSQAVADYMRQREPTTMVNRGGVYRPEMAIETWLRKTGRAIVKVGGRGIDISRIAPEYLDTTMRVANYLSFLAQIRESPIGVPRTFGASNLERIRGLKDPRDKAAQLAHDTVGNFDDNSKPVRWANRYLWIGGGLNTQAALNRRSNMLIRNTVTANRQYAFIGQRLADENTDTIPPFWKKSPMLMWMLGRYAAKLASIYAVAVASNRLLHRKADDGLPAFQRGEAHLTVPEGNDHAWSLPLALTPGWAEWAKLDHWGYYQESLLKGRFSGKEVLKELVGQFTDQAFIRMGPARMLQELHTGVSPFTNRPVSALQVPARYYGLQWALDLYEQQFHHQPVRQDWGIDLAAHALGFERYEAANQNYIEMRRAARTWAVKEKGGDSPAAQYAAQESPAFSYREALRRGDPIAAKYFLIEMSRMQGLNTDKQLDKAARRLEPLFGFSQGDQTRFLRSLHPDDAERMRVGYYYWQQWVAPHTEVRGLDRLNDLDLFITQMRHEVDRSLRHENPAKQWLRENPAEREALLERQRAARLRASGRDLTPVGAAK